MINICNDCQIEIGRYKAYCDSCKKFRKYISNKASNDKRRNNNLEMKVCKICPREFKAGANRKYCFEHRAL